MDRIPDDARARVYLDTTVILDYVDQTRGNLNSMNLMQRIKAGNGLTGVISTFTIMEAVQQRQESTHLRELINRGFSLNEIRGQEGSNRNLTLSECRRCFNDIYRVLNGFGLHIEIRNLGADDIWIEASRLVQETNICAPDAIHVATALTSGCDGFVTGDRLLCDQLKKTRRLRKEIVPILCQRGISDPAFQTQLKAALKKAKGHAPRKMTTRSQLPAEVKSLFSALYEMSGTKRKPEEEIASYERSLRNHINEHIRAKRPA